VDIIQNTITIHLFSTILYHWLFRAAFEKRNILYCVQIWETLSGTIYGFNIKKPPDDDFLMILELWQENEKRLSD